MKTIIETLKFGIEIGEANGFSDIYRYPLSDNSGWEEEAKKEFVQKFLPKTREHIQYLIETLDKEYSGNPVAENAKSKMQKELAELENLALPYVN
jgi:hypothetical protein